MANCLEEIVCPFYKYSPPPPNMKNGGKGVYLHCEGCKKGVSIDISFKNKAEYEKFKQRYCCSLKYYLDCPYAYAAFIKYEL